MDVLIVKYVKYLNFQQCLIKVICRLKTIFCQTAELHGLPFQHRKLKLMNNGKLKWVLQNGRMSSFLQQDSFGIFLNVKTENQG
jgi:hypothetical protein